MFPPPFGILLNNIAGHGISGMKAIISRGSTNSTAGAKWLWNSHSCNKRRAAPFNWSKEVELLVTQKKPLVSARSSGLRVPELIKGGQLPCVIEGSGEKGWNAECDASGGATSWLSAAISFRLHPHIPTLHSHPVPLLLLYWKSSLSEHGGRCCEH